MFDIADELGDELAIEGQRAVDDAHELLDLMLAECGATVRVERFDGTMGMSSAEHLVGHLRTIERRRRGGLRPETCLVADDSPLLAAVPAELLGCCELVPRSRVDELPGVTGFESVLLT